MKNNFKISSLVALGLAFGFSASAIPTLQFSDGTGDSIIFNGSVVSSSGSVTTLAGNLSGGTVTWVGTVGSWSFSVTVGQTLAGGSNPTIDLNVANAVASVLGTLTVQYSDNNFGPTAGTVSLGTTGGAANGATVTSTAYLGNNTLFDTSGGTLVNGDTLTSTGLYSLTIVDVITAGQTTVNSVNSLDTLLSVPDGGMTVALLGFAMVGVEGLRRKFAK